MRAGCQHDETTATMAAEYLENEPFASVRMIFDAINKPRESVLAEELRLWKFVSPMWFKQRKCFK